MKLQHAFTIPVARADAWTTLLDIGRVAQCFPGAVLDSIDGDEFTGNVKLKLGPISMTYAGKAVFVERDEANFTLKLDATGRDQRGAGTARALVIAQLTDNGADSTTVTLITDLAIAGKPAQFGRGVIDEVSSKILGQFADNLKASLSESTTGAGVGAAEVEGGVPHRSVPGNPIMGLTDAAATGDVSLNVLSPAILVPLGKRVLPALAGVGAGVFLVRAMAHGRKPESPTVIYIDLRGIWS
jgi:carbon monoxide dehydrogenase subunit G